MPSPYPIRVAIGGGTVRKFDAVVVAGADQAFEEHLNVLDHPRRLVFLSGSFLEYAEMLKRHRPSVAIYVVSGDLPEGKVFVLPKPLGSHALVGILSVG